MVYVFKHALIQDAAYESMVKKERARVHGRIADVLAASFADVVARQPETLAHHLTATTLAKVAIDQPSYSGFQHSPHRAPK